MLQYKIPQNVGIEDRIVGPLTLRQLIILSVGAAISYMLFAVLSKVYELNMLEYGVIALPFLFSAAVALIRINDNSFSKFVLLFVEFGVKPKKRVWDHRGISNLVAPDLTEQKDAGAETKKEGEPVRKNINLRDLSHILDSGGLDHVRVKTQADIDAAADDDLVTQAFFGNKKSSTDNMYWRSNKYDRGKRLNLLAKLPSTAPKKQDAPSPVPVAAAAAPSASPTAGTAAPAPKPVSVPITVSTPRVTPAATAPKPAPAKPVTVSPTPAAKPVPVKSVSATPAPSAPSTDGTVLPAVPVTADTPEKKKRRRKKKPQATSASRVTAVNTIDKNKPVQFIQKPAAPPKPTWPVKEKPQATPSGGQATPKPSIKPEPKKERPVGGEIEFKELQKGEIEINLD